MVFVYYLSKAAPFPTRLLRPHSLPATNRANVFIFVVFLTQNSRQSIGNHQNPDNSILAEQLLRERDRAEELANRFAKIKEELTEAGQREADLRSHLGKKEKEVALVKHELKEAQRKAEQEAESKKKAESERAEIRRKLEDETNRRTKEQNNHIQVFLQSALK